MSSNKKPDKGYGCAPLGCAIILLAVSAVIFYFIVKPALNERGISISSLKDKLTGGELIAQDKLAASEKLLQESQEKLRELERDGDAQLPKVPVQLYQE